MHPITRKYWQSFHFLHRNGKTHFYRIDGSLKSCANSECLWKKNEFTLFTVCTWTVTPLYHFAVNEQKSMLRSAFFVISLFAIHSEWNEWCCYNNKNTSIVDFWITCSISMCSHSLCFFFLSTHYHNISIYITSSIENAFKRLLLFFQNALVIESDKLYYIPKCLCALVDMDLAYVFNHSLQMSHLAVQLKQFPSIRGSMSRLLETNGLIL